MQNQNPQVYIVMERQLRMSKTAQFYADWRPDPDIEYTADHVETLIAQGELIETRYPVTVAATHEQAQAFIDEHDGPSNYHGVIRPGDWQQFEIVPVPATGDLGSVVDQYNQAQRVFVTYEKTISRPTDYTGDPR